MSRPAYPASTVVTPVHVVHILGALQTGGAEMALVNYLRAADRTAFRHSVVCLTREGDLADLVRDMGIPVHLRRVRTRNMPRDLVALSRWMKTENVGVVHTHMFSAAFWGRMAGLMARVPVLVTTEHGKEPWKKWWHILADRWLGRRTFRQIAVSEDVRAIRMQRDHAPAERLILVPNGVPIPDQIQDPVSRKRIREEFGLAEDQPVIGTVGRIVEAKAYPVLVEAMALLKDRVPGVHWLQVGDGPDGDRLAGLVTGRGLGDVITLAGRRTDIGDILQALDVWVMSSIREGLPVALLEAMAAARPIVATDVGGIPDAVTDGESAYLVPAADPEALAQGIAALLADTELAARLGGAARQRVVRDYGNDAVAELIESIYRTGLEAKGLRF